MHGRPISLAAALAAFFVAPPWQAAQSIAGRVASAPDGLVKMVYAARDGICGDGRTFIADRQGGQDFSVWFASGVNFSSTRLDNVGAQCVPGPVRLLLVVRDRRVVDVQPFVGPPSPATTRAGTELGIVSTAEATRYLLDLARRADQGDARNALLAASIADSVRIAGPLAAIARDRSLGSEVRESALSWMARVAGREGYGDASAMARAIAEDPSDVLAIRERAIRVIGEEGDGGSYLRALYLKLDEASLRERIIRVVGEIGSRADIDWVRGVALDARERVALRERAIRVLGESEDPKSLRDLYGRLDESALRERVIRSVAEAGSGESRQWLHGIVENRGEPAVLRERAVRALGELGDIAYLRSAYRTIDDDGLRERILRSVAEGGGSDTRQWLREIVRDGRESSALRDRAVRLLAESGAGTGELVSIYDAVADRTVRERLVGLLAERGDRAARDKLRAIAENDPDEDIRRRALRRLAESKS